MTVPLVPQSGGLVVAGDNLPVMAGLPGGVFQLIYLDPPFNTGRTQTGTARPAAADATARVRLAYDDAFSDYTAFLVPRLEQARRLLSPTGTLVVHCDQREAHYIKVALDVLMGRHCFKNELIWAYEWGGKSRSRWPAKHDTLLAYARDARAQHFDDGEVERAPYLAPGWHKDPAKVAAGKRLTDVWWHTVVPTNGRERTGYPTQKPEGVLRRLVLAYSRPGDLVGDFFAGSGTIGAVAHDLGRPFVLADSNPQAIAVMRGRLPPGTLFAGG